MELPELFLLTVLKHHCSYLLYRVCKWRTTNRYRDRVLFFVQVLLA